MTEATLVAKTDREKMAEIMFEGMNADSIYLASQPILSLYACGRMDGVVLEMGYGTTQVVPCHKGYPVANTSLRSNLAGQKLDEYLTKLLEEQNIKGLDINTVRDIKENHAYIALNYDTQESVKKIYKLPDGSDVTIGTPLYTCPEALFQPSLAGHSSDGIHKMLNEGISKISTATGENVSTFYSSIVVTGGSSLFPGMLARLEKE